MRATPSSTLVPRTGRDGIHGASLLASREFDARSEELRPAVQVGDPFTENLLIEACLELMQRDLIVAIQDMGAAGLTSSSVEMAGRGGTGFVLNLDAIPTREDGISAYELLLSESQERMLLVAKAGCEDEVRALFSRWDLPAVVVGRVTDDGLFRAAWQGREVVRLPVSALTDAAPAYERPARRPDDLDQRQTLDLADLPLPGDYNAVLLRLLTAPNLASKEWVYRQYDSLVSGNTVVQPGSDAAVLRIKGTTTGDRPERGLQQPLLRPGPVSRRADRRGRERAQPGRQRRATAGRVRLSEFRQPGKTRGHVAVPAGHCRHARRVSGARAGRGQRERQLL